MAMKETLVVIGNGMAGARFVEELLARNGREHFDIVMFGDEPYGNYNRILLSNVLAGSHEPKDIFLNPLGWYEKNGITLHAGIRVESIDRERKMVHGVDGVRERYDRSLAPLRREVRIGRALARLTYDLPRVRRWVFERHGQKLVEAMTDVLMGDRTYASLLSRAKTWMFLLGLRRA